MNQPKVVGFENPTAEGVNLTFDSPICLNGGINVPTWFFSWQKIGEALLLQHNVNVFKKNLSKSKPEISGL